MPAFCLIPASGSTGAVPEWLIGIAAQPSKEVTNPAGKSSAGPAERASARATLASRDQQ
jgi:hypothetical protein